MRYGVVALMLALGAARAAEPAPLDGIDPARVPARVKPPMSAPPQTLAMLGLRDGRWDTIAARPDGKMIAASEPEGAIFLWSLPSFKQSARLTHREVVVLAFAPDGKTLAAGDAKGNLHLWTLGPTSPATRAQLPAIHKDGPMWALAFAPDGRSLATGGADGVIKLWDLKPTKPALKAAVAAHGKVVRQLAFSPDGALLASAGSADRNAKLWDVGGATPREKAVLKCDGAVASVSFAPDGKALATASFDGKVRVWKINGEAPEAELVLDMGRKPRLVEFTRDGRALAMLLLDEQGEHIAVRDRAGARLFDLDFIHHIQGMTFLDPHHLATANEDSIYVIRLEAK